MTSQGWVKFYEDGSQVLGYNELVEEGKASWTRSPQDNIVAVELTHGTRSARIVGRGEFWQTDDYELALQHNSHPTLKRRKIMKKITEHDHFITSIRNVHSGRVLYTFSETHSRVEDGHVVCAICLHPTAIGCWFVVDIENDAVTMQIVKERH